ncbi:MAG: ATP-grasp domain-containing protein [Nitrososphaerales archaeon]
MPLRVGIAEYFSGSVPYLDDELLLEGYAMLKSTIDDFLATGVSVSTILHQSFRSLSELYSVKVLWSAEGSAFEHNLKLLSQSVDYILLIAPEYILPTLLEQISSAEFLNSSPDSIRAVSDKCRFAKRLAEVGLEAPKSACFEVDARASEIKAFCSEIGYPVAVKPAVGAGCEGLSIVEQEGVLEAAFKKARQISPEGKIVVQKWCKGLAASVSLIVSEDNIIPLSLNRQFIKVGSPNQASTYLGGVVPLPHQLTKKAFEAALKAVNAFKGLKGYVGVDLVLADKPLVLEVNPRITVSYIGLSRVLEGGVANLMIKMAAKSANSPLRLKGYVSFIKATLPPQSKVEHAKVLCSPIKRNGKRCFLMAKGDSYENSLQQLKADINLFQAKVDVNFDDLSA